MRKVFTVLVVILVIVICGGWYAKNVITNKVADQVLKTVASPGVQQQVAQLLKKAQTNPAIVNQALSDALKQSGGTLPTGLDMGLRAGSLPQSAIDGTENLSFQNRADAIKFAMTRFSPAEIARMMQLYANRNQLTAAQKEEIKRELLSHFTAKELQAMLLAAGKA